jgi:hypothetical protein
VCEYAALADHHQDKWGTTWTFSLPPPLERPQQFCVDHLLQYQSLYWYYQILEKTASNLGIYRKYSAYS